MANGGTGGFTNSSQIGGGGGRFNKCEDTDSGTGSSSEAHVIRHIDRNILACQICQQRYKEPKVRQLQLWPIAIGIQEQPIIHSCLTLGSL